MTTQEGPGRAIPQNIAQALEQRGLAEIEKQTRKDMAGNPSVEAVDNEIRYRQSAEREAVKALSQGEQTVAWKFRMSATEYSRGKK